ncbi:MULTISPECIES: polysaccharide pyruvyl transferase family protein [Streptomyces]|uniref:polysaccharide pyruvyl transferase family protein n=1 Tax=Streptomyces TaxID=1883 RepID=UPI000D1F9019|nr:MULTISPECIES: polysaccharide pyruvyl transferase family protein [Streptomyces]
MSVVRETESRPERSGHGRLLLTGWFSFTDGEATAGDVLSLHRVQASLDRRGTAYDIAWSSGFRPDGLHLEDLDPDRYSTLVFLCGPLHGPQVEALHERFAHCARLAVGTSVLDPADPAVLGFHHVLPRDAPGREPRRDLAASAPPAGVPPVVGVVLTHGQHEYGSRRRHESAGDTLTGWLGGKDCARLELDTRLDIRDWRHCATTAQFEAAVARLDLVVTNRLHGLVVALRCGVPALAVDPVQGGAKLTAQARACRWPAVVAAESADAGRLDHWWDWCLGPGVPLARLRGAEFRDAPESELLRGLDEALRSAPH